jgi:hypothetical protein
MEGEQRKKKSGRTYVDTLHKRSPGRLRVLHLFLVQRVETTIILWANGFLAKVQAYSYAARQIHQLNFISLPAKSTSNFNCKDAV